MWFLHISEDRETNAGSAVSPKVTVLSNGPITHVTKVRVSAVTVNLYRFIDPCSFCFCLVHQSARSSFMPTASHKYFLESAASHTDLYTVSHLFFSCDWPLPLTGFVLSLLFSARANLPHRHSFGLLFHPPTLGKTVCSKDCNLTANLYGFLQGRAPSLA